MSNLPPAESELDDALAHALKNQKAFATWFLSKTRFALEGGECTEVRADNPWSRVAFQVVDAQTGCSTELRKDRETDVLAIFVTPAGRRIALHIENKLANGAFTPGQPESYRARLEQWRMRPKLGNYDEATSILVAPQAFYDRNRVAAGVFEAFVSYESIAEFVPEFSTGVGAA